MNALHDLHRRLSSSTGEAATKVDLVITLHSNYPPVTATVATVFLPSPTVYPPLPYSSAVTPPLPPAVSP